MELDDQADANAKLQAQLQKAAADAQALKGKYEKDITVISEEFDNSKLVYSLSHFQCSANYEYSLHVASVLCIQYVARVAPTCFTVCLIVGWLVSTVGRTPVFGRRTDDPVLSSACSRRVTTMWVNRPL